jgi:ssDNA-binding Zn-finger/Zn-ribbon topoisomerase 1
MGNEHHSKEPSGRCPRCGSEAVYKYGKTRHGKKRFRCVVCDRQFGENPRIELKDRPVCQACGRKMHVYRKDPNVVRFRCSGYPRCRNFVKISIDDYMIFFHPETATAETNTPS